MITYETKNIVTVTKGVIGHGCNCSGGFGSGVAGAIRQTFPKMFETYMSDYNAGILELGFTHVMNINGDLHIANMMTQQTFGGDPNVVYADADAIEECLRSVCTYAHLHELDLYIPPIGCGLGGLNWESDVKPRVEKVSAEFEHLNIIVCDIQ
jgi:O-acetyl-ADP-ribose deacetylase (regulator of RNase III)